MVAAESSDLLEPQLSPVRRVRNTPEGFAELLAWLQQLGVLQRIVLETSGGYEEAVLAFLREAGLPVVRVSSAYARAFLKSQQGQLKTDARDARSLARFGKVLSGAVGCRSEAQDRWRGLQARREQVRWMLEAERKRLQGASPWGRASLERTIAHLEQE